MRLRTILAAGLSLGALTLATLSLGQTASAPADAAQVEHGRYLAILGDCSACHTRKDGEPFTGGMAFKTKFGTIYSTNITPDAETGIGTWSQDAFWQAMHKGRRADGAHLYPAFPYPYFTKLERADSDALRAYLMTLKPVSYRPRPNRMIFPANIRGVMAIWNALFFRPGLFRPSPERSAEWNRGAFIVTGPGHCGACHTPKNILMADEMKRAQEGGLVEDWFAPDLNGDARGGLGGWSEGDIVEFLKTGHNARSNGSASMSDVLIHSTTRMSDADLRAIAVYLKSLGPRIDERAPTALPANVMAAGGAIYADQCSACHGAEGVGQPGLFPPLAGNANVQARDPTTIDRYLLTGSPSAATSQRPTPVTMPAFAWKLTDDELAAVATYVRNSWGNAAPQVTAGQAGSLRHKVAAHPQKPPPSRT